MGTVEYTMSSWRCTKSLYYPGAPPARHLRQRAQCDTYLFGMKVAQLECWAKYITSTLAVPWGNFMNCEQFGGVRSDFVESN